MPELMNLADIEEIDILKVDIEGGEEALFEKNTDWLNKVKLIIIEIHGAYTLERLEADLKPFGFRVILPEESGMHMIIAVAESSNVV